MAYQIRGMTEGDWERVRSIYMEGIRTGDATFETDVPSWDRWDASHLKECRLIACDGAAVLGWAALSRISSRQVYAGVAEVSIYVAQEARGKGIGQALLAALIAESERCGIWTLQAGIFPENAASIVLHRKNGFREVGRRERLGKMNGVWRDVVLLERRSRVAGQD